MVAQLQHTARTTQLLALLSQISSPTGGTRYFRRVGIYKLVACDSENV